MSVRRSRKGQFVSASGATRYNCLSILEVIGLFAKNRRMRRYIELLLCLSAFAGCHTVKQRGNATDPQRATEVDAMHAAEAEAKKQADNW
jgi:hypothetical protein